MPLTSCISGEIKGGSITPDQLMVQVDEQRGFVSSGGEFQLCGITLGLHFLTVTTMHGDPIWQNSVSVVPGHTFVDIVMPGNRNGTGGPGTVSIRRLLHKPPRGAVREFQRSFASRDTQPIRSVQHLQRAVEIDPNFLEAQNNLGITYIRLGRLEEAVRCLTKAAELDPADATVFSNLAAALLSTNRYPDAEEAARRALRLGAAAPSVHFMLGASLALQRKNTREALDNLRQAGEAVPAVHLLAGNVLIGLNLKGEAAAEFRAYLQSGAPAAREQVQHWLAAFERRP